MIDIQNGIQFLTSWGFTPTELISLASSFLVGAEMLWRGQKGSLRKHIEAEALRVADSTLTNKERLQVVVDKLQEKFKILSVIPDAFLINLINEVYITRVKPQIKLSGANKDAEGNTQDVNNQNNSDKS